MRKFSIMALVLAMMLVVSACSSSSGLLLKEATLKQLDLESFQASSTITVDIDSALFKNAFKVEMDTKQVDYWNTSSDIKLDASLLALAGVDVAPGQETVTLSLLTHNGDTIVTSSQDQKGIVLSSTSELLADEFGEGKEEQFQELFLSVKDIFTDLIKDYIEDYSYSFDQIESHGNVNITLPNSKTVTTEHIEVQLSVVDLIDMLQYSLTYFLDNKEMQDSFYEAIAALPELVMPLVEGTDEEINPAELKDALINEARPEINAGIKEFIAQLEEFKTTPLLANEEVANNFARLSLHSYVDPKDKETYQTEFELTLKYTDELAQLDLEGMKGAPFLPGDSITISAKDQYWNHNGKIDPIKVPNQLVSMEELVELESVEDAKAVLGENSLLARLAEPFINMGALDFGYIELKVDENKAETMDGEFDLSMYINNGQTMAPIAAIGERLGADVTWDPNTKQITVAANDHLVQVTVEQVKNNAVTVDGAVRSDLFVDVENGTSYVNIRAFAEALDWEVLWVEETRSILLFP
ncbi:hypothetical protein BEP19_02780 [Ammoniphilus oxalaticus]|uniref:Copper amine oxidase-like N-terminal domain-containing protein n=1 Tax=Ammoniphilus oxalaticus TaxID=66863 RepID=A0A419SNJ4_9BACL|nr:copper amine oxidase N-terminal domain-containing protein [Ammoniphilus oxalaticus]RKD25874.1 hypothetical protein BEP19_02780 [Ammoniphilus oxalaticus]